MKWQGLSLESEKGKHPEFIPEFICYLNINFSQAELLICAKRAKLANILKIINTGFQNIFPLIVNASYFFFISKRAKYHNIVHKLGNSKFSNTIFHS